MFSVFFCFLFCCRPHTRPRVSEKQKKASPNSKDRKWEHKKVCCDSCVPKISVVLLQVKRKTCCVTSSREWWISSFFEKITLKPNLINQPVLFPKNTLNLFCNYRLDKLFLSSSTYLQAMRKISDESIVPAYPWCVTFVSLIAVLEFSQGSFPGGKSVRDPIITLVSLIIVLEFSQGSFSRR